MDKKTKKILWGGGLVALGILVYKLVFKNKASKVTNGSNNSFPIYPNPACSDGEAGGCEYSQVVSDVQLFLSNQGYDIEVDGLFGNETAETIEYYLLNITEAEYTALGYNYVETPNYITLAFYESL